MTDSATILTAAKLVSFPGFVRTEKEAVKTGKFNFPKADSVAVIH